MQRQEISNRSIIVWCVLYGVLRINRQKERRRVSAIPQLDDAFTRMRSGEAPRCAAKLVLCTTTYYVCTKVGM